MEHCKRYRNAEPNGNKMGKVTGSFKPTVAGVYKLRMNVTDQSGVTSYATTSGDYEAYFVAYDPKVDLLMAEVNSFHRQEH